MQTLNLAAGRHVEKVAHAKQLLCALFVQNGARVDFGRHHVGNTGREVRLDRTGDDVNGWALRRRYEVDARRTRHLCEALNAGFNLFAGHHHQVSHLVNHDNDVRYLLERDFLSLIDRAACIGLKARLDFFREAAASAFQLFDLLIEACKVTYARLGHHLIAAFHLANRPFERSDRLFRVDHDRREKVRNAFIDRKLKHFRVDHDEAALLRWQLVHEREDHRVDTNRLT